MGSLLHTIFYEPLFNLLVFVYGALPVRDFGLAVVVVTVVVKLVLYPLSAQSIRSQKAMLELQPKLAELKARHKDNKQALAQATIQLYRENKVNPFSSCLPLIIQLPFLFALYSVFINGISSRGFEDLYSFVANPGSISSMTLGIFDLSKASVVLAILAGAAQFWQAKMLQHKKPQLKNTEAADENVMATMNKKMLYIMPVVTVAIGSSLPGGLTLYWLVTTVLTALQQLVVFKKIGGASSVPRETK